MKNTENKTPKIFLDTNILLDYLLERGPDGIAAERIFEASLDGQIELVAAALSLTNLSYIVRKDLTYQQTVQAIKNFCGLCDICVIDADKIQKAIDSHYTEDFEDGLQIQCAVDSKADYIVTRDIKGFTKSPIKAINSVQLGKELSL